MTRMRKVIIIRETLDENSVTSLPDIKENNKLSKIHFLQGLMLLLLVANEVAKGST